jgi:Tol biopolymer transport system component
MKRFRSALLVLLLIVLVGCNGILDVGIERTPTPDYSPAATVAALTAENAELATRVATLTAPIPTTPHLGQIVYVQGGDIWVKALPDSKPQRLTTDGRNREPRWSPSGQWLAFRKETQVIVDQSSSCDIPNPRPGMCPDNVVSLQEQLWVMEVDGSAAHRLESAAEAGAFAWSPTDDRLAYVTAGGELQTVNADGSNVTSLVPRTAADRSKPGRVGNIRWSPDGTAIAYEWRVQQPDLSLTYQGLWKVSADGKDQVELYVSGVPKKGEALLVGWTPLGRSVLFWQPGEARPASLVDGVSLYAVPADKSLSKGDVPILLGSEAMLAYPDFVAPAPSSPQSVQGGAGEAVALAIGAGRSTWTNKRIEVAGKMMTPKGVAAIFPAWSPNGTRLAYTGMPDRASLSVGASARQELMQRHIGVVSVSSDPRPRWLTDSPAYRDERPLWSADGNYILFARIDIKGRASLWVVSVDGGPPRQVVDELTPAPDPFGLYGHVEWDSLFDWWRGSVPPVGGPTPTP